MTKLATENTMKKILASALFTAILSALSVSAFAKLPPLSDEAKAKADEAKAKTAHTAKVDAYALCKAQDKVAAHVQAGKPVATPACADPGKFVYTPPEPAAPAPAVASAAAPAAAPAAPSAPAAPKK